MARIQDRDRIYDFFRPWTDAAFRLSYRRIRYVGRENIPSDGAVIFAPNHTNALCDAIAVLSIDSSRKVFVARADIFHNPKIAWLLNGFKIMPIHRLRDGLNEVRQNDETLQQAVDTLQDSVPFCILPEGTHRPMHSLLPLNKGIFRIALAANEQFGAQKPVYIVPVGLEYGDYFHLWDSLLVNIGKPLNVTEFVRTARQKCLQENGTEMTDPQITLALREELTCRMREQILWVPDDEDYASNWAELKAHRPKLFADMDRPCLPAWLRWMLLILCFPLFLLSAVVTLPMGIIIAIGRHKVNDPAFRNSVQYVLQFLLIPLSLFTALPFWMVVEEYMYQIRHLHAKC